MDPITGYEVSDKAIGSGLSGSSGSVLGGRIDQTCEDDIDRLVSTKSTLRSKRSAAIDGQMRRRINDIKANSS